MSDPATPLEEIDLLAAELALGVLTGEERARALRLQLSDPAFRAAVAVWHDRLAPIFDDVPERPVDPQLWSRIETALDGRVSPDLASRLHAWRLGAVAASAVAAVLALVLMLEPGPAPPPRPQIAIAQLATKSGDPILAVQYDAATGALRVHPAVLPDPRKSPELWVIPAGGAPHSLGLVARDRASDVVVDPAARDLIRPGASLAVTMEPAEGAPHAAPSGAILGSAPLTAL